MKLITKEQESSCGVKIAMQWVKSSEATLKGNRIPAKLSETINNLYIDGTLEEMGLIEEKLSQTGYERIKAKAISHALWKLQSGHAPLTLEFFTNKKEQEKEVFPTAKPGDCGYTPIIKPNQFRLMMKKGKLTLIGKGIPVKGDLIGISSTIGLWGISELSECGINTKFISFHGGGDWQSKNRPFEVRIVESVSESCIRPQFK